MNNEIIVGVNIDYAPFAYLNNQRNYTGFDVELIKLLKCHSECKFVITSWQRLHSDLQSKKFDVAIGGISLTKYRKQNFLSSEIPIVDYKVFLVNNNKLNNFDSLASVDQDNITIVANRGGTNELFVDKNIKQARVIKTENNLDAIAILTAGKVDLMITDKVEAQYYITSNSSKDSQLIIKEPQKPLSEVLHYGFLYNKDANHLKQQIDHQMKQLTNEQITKLKSKFKIY